MKKLLLIDLKAELKIQLRKFKMCFGGQIASAVRGNIVSVLLFSGCVPLWQQAKKGLMIKNKASLSATCIDVKKLLIFITYQL